MCHMVVSHDDNTITLLLFEDRMFSRCRIVHIVYVLSYDDHTYDDDVV